MTTILVVEDNEMNLDMLTRRLQRRVSTVSYTHLTLPTNREV